MGVSKWILGLATALSWWAAIGAVLAPVGAGGTVFSIGPGGGHGPTAWLETGRTTPLASSTRAHRTPGERAGSGPALVRIEAATLGGAFSAACNLAAPAPPQTGRPHDPRVTRGPPTP